LTKLATLPDGTPNEDSSKDFKDQFGAEESKTGAGGDELDFLADPAPASSKVQQPKPAA